MNYYKLSFCTVCMNRTEHLKQTLLKNLADNAAYPHLEFVLLNYGSQDDMHDWVMEEMKDQMHAGLLKYYRAGFPQLFKMSHSKNMAFRLATGDVLVSVDADNYTGPGFAAYVNRWFNRESQIFLAPPWTDAGARKWWDVQGRLCVWKDDFLQLRGYDEAIVDYGYEDQDLKQRLMQAGIRKTVIRNARFLQAIQHTDELRVKSGITRQLMATLLLKPTAREVWECWYLRTDHQYERFRVAAGADGGEELLPTDGAQDCRVVKLWDLRTGAYESSQQGITLLDHTGRVIDELRHNTPTALTSPGGALYYRLQPGALMDRLLLGRSCYLGKLRLQHNRQHREAVNPQGFGQGPVTAWPAGEERVLE